MLDNIRPYKMIFIQKASPNVGDAFDFAYIYKSDTNEFILGLPSWFFYSCVLALVVINILVFVAVKCFFKDINLD